MKKFGNWLDFLTVLLMLFTLFVLFCVFYRSSEIDLVDLLVGPPSPSPAYFPAGISVTGYELHQNGELDLEIGQGLGRPIEVTGVICTLNQSPDYASRGVNNYASDPIKMPSGSRANLSKSGTAHTIVCTDENGNRILDTNTVKPSEGDMYGGYDVHYRLYINYTEIDTNKSKVVGGSLWQKSSSPCWRYHPCSCIGKAGCLLVPSLILVWLMIGLSYFSFKPKKT